MQDPRGKRRIPLDDDELVTFLRSYGEVVERSGLVGADFGGRLFEDFGDLVSSQYGHVSRNLSEQPRGLGSGITSSVLPGFGLRIATTWISLLDIFAGMYELDEMDFMISK
jgi:hypothetical protein